VRVGHYNLITVPILGEGANFQVGLNNVMGRSKTLATDNKRNLYKK